MNCGLLAVFNLMAAHLACATDSALLGQENAAWSRSFFFRGFDPTTKEKLTDQALADFASRLERNGIRYVYIFSGPYLKDGHLPEYAFSPRARATVAFFKKTYPQIKILPWIGGVEGKTVFLENDAWLKNSLQDTKKLMMSASFDGVHIDLEYTLFPRRGASTFPVKTYDAHWVEFHKKLRETLPRAFISTVAVSSAPGTKPWKHKHSQGDLREVSSVVDQVAFMYYETNLHEFGAYRENMRLQLRQIQEMKTALGKKSPEYLFGIGTFESTMPLKPYRDMRFENITTTLTVLKELIGEISPSEHLIDGLAIYCEWLTTPEDWKRIRDQWTGIKQ